MKVFAIIFSSLILSASIGYAQDDCFDCFSKLKKAKEHTLLGSTDTNSRVLASVIGCKAPDFDVKSMDGEQLNLSKLKGKVVVLNFWFIGCAPCITEMPALNRLVDEYKGKDVVFVAFGRDLPDHIKAFLKKKEFKFKVVPSDFDFANRYCIIAGWPTTMVIDKNGVVRLAFSGGRIDDQAKTYAFDKISPVVDQYLK